MIVGSVATPVAAAMADVAAEGQDGAAHALAGEPASGQGRVVVPHAAVDRGDGDPDRRALEEDRRQDLRLPRLCRRATARPGCTDIKPLAEKAGIKLVAVERFARSDTSVTGQALKLDRRQPGRDPGRRLGQRRGDAAQGAGRARLSEGQDLPDARRGDDGPDPRRRRRRRGLVRLVGPGGRRREAARRRTPARQLGMQVQGRVREGQRQGLGEPVRRARLRRHHRPAEGGADRAARRASRERPSSAPR